MSLRAENKARYGDERRITGKEETKRNMREMNRERKKGKKNKRKRTGGKRGNMAKKKTG